MNPVKEYFASPRLNASRLKELHNPKWIKYKMDNPDDEDEEKRHFRVGSALDCMMTTPEEFDNEFVTINAMRPSGKMGFFVDNLPLGLTEESSKEDYVDTYNAAGYKAKLETVIKNLWNTPKYKRYYLERVDAKGKTVLSLDEMFEVKNCKNLLYDNPHVREIWLNSPTSNYFQLPIYFEYKETECKGMLDILRVDKVNKIIQPVDLKTTARSVLGFAGAFLTFGYNIQAAMYDAALRSDAFAPQFKEMTGDDIKEYEIKPMKFLVVEKKGSNPSRYFNCTENDMKACYEGGTTKNGRVYPGLNDLIDDFNWHVEHNYWALPRDLVDDGSVDLNLFEK
jgi:hypothetical protein